MKIMNLIVFIFRFGDCYKELQIIIVTGEQHNLLKVFLNQKKTIGISNVNTRALTAKLRDHGSLKACIAPL